MSQGRRQVQQSLGEVMTRVVAGGNGEGVIRFWICCEGTG